MTCRPCCAGSPPTSACTTSTTCAVEFRFIGCRLFFASTPVWQMSADLVCVRALHACASRSGTKRRGGSFRFASCGLGPADHERSTALVLLLGGIGHGLASLGVSAPGM